MSELRRERYAVYARRVGDLSDLLAGVGIDYLDTRAMRNEQPVRERIEAQIVVADVPATERIARDDAVLGGLGGMPETAGSHSACGKQRKPESALSEEIAHDRSFPAACCRDSRGKQ